MASQVASSAARGGGNEAVTAGGTRDNSRIKIHQRSTCGSRATDDAVWVVASGTGGADVSAQVLGMGSYAGDATRPGYDVTLVAHRVIRGHVSSAISSASGLLV